MKNSWNLRLNRALFLCFNTLPLLVCAQFSKPEEKFAGEEQYIYPIFPGKPGSLAGTMGELRSTHFHSGIDIRTDNMVGLPVQASKSGFVSRISITGSGYGNVLYITHPDGNTTLYAHLEKFLGPLGEYILQEQYRRKANEVDLYFREDQFVVKQGDTVALSGNTGSTAGPHLHFDIRDSNNFALNPLKIAGFPELVDKMPPAAEKIALRTLDLHSRINDQFGRFEFYAQRVGTNYILPNAILASGNIGVELVAKDKLAPQSPFYGGVNFIEMRVDSQLVFAQDIERVNVDETRAIYTLMDYKTMRNKGTRFYKLYIDDGNTLPFYNHSPGNGKIKISGEKESAIDIKMQDSDGNSSRVLFKLRPTSPIAEVKSLAALNTASIGVEISENTMVVTTKPNKAIGNQATVYIKGSAYPTDPAYYNYNQAVFLIDLRKALPDSIVAGGKSYVTHFNATVPSGTEYTFYSDLLDIQFPSNALYDTLYLSTSYTRERDGSEIFTLGSRNVPLHQNINVSLRPQGHYAGQRNMAIYRMAGKSYTYLGGEWRNDRMHFSTREFGDFVLLTDHKGPGIAPLTINNQTARFRINDDLSGIANIEATIDGQWLSMYYDKKSATIWSSKLNPAIPLRGQLVLRVTDNAGNTSTYEKKIP